MAELLKGLEAGMDIEDAPRREKALMQLNWVNIVITAMPATGRCGAQGALLEKRVIIDDVSGAVLPGQFLAIIGASGKIASAVTVIISIIL